MSSISNGPTQFPCIRCLVPLHNTCEAGALPKKTTEIMRAIYNEANDLYKKTVQLRRRKCAAQARLKKALEDDPTHNTSLNKRKYELFLHAALCLSNVTDIFNIFTVEPLFLFHLEISKRLEECIAGYSATKLNNADDEEIVSRTSVRGAKTLLLGGGTAFRKRSKRNSQLRTHMSTSPHRKNQHSAIVSLQLME